MPKFVNLYNQSVEGEVFESELTRVPEVLKANPEGTRRSVYFRDDQKEGVFGPFVMVFAVRRAREILLENCAYHDMDIQLEVEGRKLPQLPSNDELARILAAESTLVHINGSVFKPSGEVYGFQQVYDDSVKCIDALKKLGLAQETLAIYATPEDITIEVHAGPIGIEGRSDTAELYYRLLCYIADIREAGGRPVKNSIRTVILQSCDPKFQILLPGSTHPALHRPKVNVGASHFAYGIAAFSDYCGRKRTLQECLQETFNWVKFVQTQLPPMPGLAERIEKLPKVPSAAGSGKRQRPVSNAGSDQFQSLKKKIEECSSSLIEPEASVRCFAPVLGKALGGGWQTGGLHFIVGVRESGKAVFMMQQAMSCAASAPVLYVSFEHDFREFALRAASSAGVFNLGDTLSQLNSGGDAAGDAKKSILAGINKVAARAGGNFYFCGCASVRGGFDCEEILQLAEMIPQTSPAMIFIESVELAELEDKNALARLKNAAMSRGVTIWISVHTQSGEIRRPHFVEEADLEALKRFQRFADSIVAITTEKANLRKFVAMIKGQIDAQLVGSLEQKALQMAGGKRYKGDTNSFVRLIHTRSGRRELILMLLQPDTGRFFELASLPLQRS